MGEADYTVVVAFVALACFWVGLIVGVHVNDWYSKNIDEDNDQD